MADQPVREGFILQPGEGRTIAYLGGQSVFKITTAQTGSGWGLTVETFPAGFRSLMHMHPTEDSGFYVLSGRMRVRCGDLEGATGPGGFIWLPRGVEHAFMVEGDEPCTWINVQGPTGDFARVIEAMGAEVTADNPSPKPREMTPEERAEISRRHNLVQRGPSPFA